MKFKSLGITSGLQSGIYAMQCLQTMEEKTVKTCMFSAITAEVERGQRELKQVRDKKDSRLPSYRR